MVRFSERRPEPGQEVRVRPVAVRNVYRMRYGANEDGDPCWQSLQLDGHWPCGPADEWEPAEPSAPVDEPPVRPRDCSMIGLTARQYTAVHVLAGLQADRVMHYMPCTYHAKVALEMTDELWDALEAER